MKTSIAASLLCCIALSAGATVAEKTIAETSQARIWNSFGRTMPYRLRLPAEMTSGVKYPLVVHLHGAGSRGTNNVAQLNVGPRQIDDWARRNSVEYILLAPQCPEGQKWVDTPWGDTSHRMAKHPNQNLSMALAMIEDAIWRYPVDPARVYVIGVSMGGYATWEVLQRRSEWFAAAIPMCGGGDDTLVDRMKDVSIWAFHGDADKIVPVCRSRQMVSALWSISGRVRYREYPGTGHNCWTPTLSDDSVIQWLFDQRKNLPPTPKNVPELMKTFDGRDVASKADWENVRRGELLECFKKNVFGRRPQAAAKPENVKFVCIEESPAMDGAATLKRIRAEFTGPCGKGSFPFVAFIPKSPKPAATFVLICNRSSGNIDHTRKHKTGFWPAEDIVARGYATIAFLTTDLAADKAAGFSQGIFPVFQNESERDGESWATLSAWAWGASRIMDWIETEKSLDPKRVAVVGHSRGGKTALWTGATDTRFALACSNNSGCSGAKLNHIDLPESEHIAQITKNFHYWFCTNYLAYVGRDDKIDFDQHELVALMAPRLVAIASATEDSWAGPCGEWWTARLASPAWELYGLHGLVGDVWAKPECPQQGGSISYHLRTGPHALTQYDWKCYMDFADLNGWRR